MPAKDFNPCIYSISGDSGKLDNGADDSGFLKTSSPSELTKSYIMSDKGDK